MGTVIITPAAAEEAAGSQPLTAEMAVQAEAAAQAASAILM